MNKFFALLGILAFPLALSAQETAIDKITAGTCACMLKKDFREFPRQKFEEELGMCMLEAASANLSQLQAEENIQLSDQASMQQLGQKIGVKLAAACPDLFSKMMELYSDDPALQSEVSVRELKVEEGLFQSVAENGITSLVMKNGSQDRSFLCLESFEGASLLGNAGSALAGKKIRVTYEEKELYSLQVNGYQIKRVVTKIEIVN